MEVGVEEVGDHIQEEDNQEEDIQEVLEHSLV